MKHKRNSYQKYKDTRDVLTKKLINKVVYILLDRNKKIYIHPDGHPLIFYKFKTAIEYIINNKGEDEWRIKKIRLDITTI